MIEFCTKKRMLLLVTLLGGLTILVLIVESHWTDTSTSKPFIEAFENNSTCLAGENYEIIAECQPCTALEIASKSVGICVHSRYKEVLRCKSGETVTRSCDKVAWLEERTFWKFESLMFAFAVLSCLSVYWRENILRQRIIRKVARQLRSSA
ncbi:protein JTB [Belonocnema kinseyi]|uniref:protein JTB n=1 Tax=Belonocnema kinseyi TaxID=2817044 RepID=UPI00143D70F8|nr:protein JTB [Belonocnema kinseyi]